MSVQKFYKLAKKDLFPLCRSLTGDGVRKTLKVIRKSHPSLKIYSIKFTLINIYLKHMH